MPVSGGTMARLRNPVWPQRRKRVALFVALEFEQGVHVESVGGAEFVDLDGVVDDQFHRLQRVDERGIAAQGLHGVAHGGQVDDAGDAGEILQEDAAGGESDFLFRLRLAVPICERAHFFFGDVASVFGAELVLEQDAQGEREMFGGDALLVEGVEAVDFEFFVADFEGGFAVETIHRHECLPRYEFGRKRISLRRSNLLV